MPLVIAFALLLNPLTDAAALHIASAASFRPTLEKLVQRYRDASDEHISISSGASGVLYAQIVNGARFDLLLAADDWRPRALIDQALAQRDSLLTYAIGRLILVSHQSLPDQADPRAIAALLARADTRVALANPQTAPYGAAARDTLRQLGLWRDVAQRLDPTAADTGDTKPPLAAPPQPVFANNAAQAFQFFTTGNTDFALVGLAQWLNWSQRDAQRAWRVPTTYHQALRHDAVVLNRAGRPDQAHHFLRFLSGTEARGVLVADGYGLD